MSREAETRQRDERRRSTRPIDSSRLHDLRLSDSRIAVIGGGITGLTAALRLAQQGIQVTLWERGELLGGQANAFPVAGTAIERFYHHLFQSDREIVALAEEIGIGDRLLWLPSNVGYFADGRIWPLNGALDLLRLGFLPIHDRLRVGLVTAYLQRVRDWKRFESVTAASWLRRALGSARLRPHVRRTAASEVRSLSRSGRHGLVLGQDLVAHDLPALAAAKASGSATFEAASTS